MSVTLAALILLSVNLVFVLAPPPPNLNSATEMKWRTILKPTGPTPDFLIFGDSSGIYGVTPSVLDSLLGTLSCNCCTYRPMTTISHATLLHEFIRRWGGTEGVLLVQTFDS